MPPKKKEIKKEAVVLEDKGPMPKQYVNFKFNFNITQIELENHTLCFEFINAEKQIERYDLPLINTWEQKDAENQPNLVTYQKEFENLFIDEDICKLLTQKQFKFTFVHTEESKVVQEFQLDLSEILTYEQTKLQYKFSNDKLKIMQIENFEFILDFDKPLLQDVFRHYLNPMEVEVIGVKNLPVLNDKNYEPCYVQYTNFNGETTKTSQKLQKQKIKWGSKHVFLMGLEDQIKMEEKFRGQYLKMEVHDKDELMDTKIRDELEILDIQKKIQEEEEKNKPPEEDLPPDPKAKNAKKDAKKPPPKKEEPKKDPKKDAKKKQAGGDVKLDELKYDPQELSKEYLTTNYAVSVFVLQDFLKPNVRELKLRSPLIPVKKYEDLESGNLALNTTARQTMKGLIESATYLQSDAFLVVGFKLAHPLNTFVMPEEPKEDAEPVKEDPKKPAKPAKPPKGQQPPATPQDQKAEDEDKTKDEKKLAIYERAIYIMPYKSDGFIEQIQNSFYEINIEAAKITQTGTTAIRALTNIALSAKQKQDRTFDYLSGFQIIDNHFRLVFLEGLKDGAMKRLENMVPKNIPNTETRKILKNKSILYEDRLYQDFNMEIKRIRLRENLSYIISKPSIYIRTKVPEHIYNVILQLQDLRKCSNLKQVDQFSYYPNADHLIQMERKYSDALTPEDIHGYQIETKKAKKKVRLNDSNTLQDTKLNSTTQQTLPAAPVKDLLSAEDLKTIDISAPQQAYEEEQEVQDYTLPQINTKSKSHTSTFRHSTKIKRETNHYTYQMNELDPKELQSNEEVYIYASQKLNYYDKKQRELRQAIQKDPHNFYTYSDKYLTLSIDPYSVEDVKREKETLEQTKLAQKPRFQPVPKKTRDEWQGHPKKPHQATIDLLRDHPWYQQTQETANFKKPTRGLKIQGQEDFKQHIGTIKVFSNPDVIEGEKLNPAEKERQEKLQKQQQIEQWKSKLKGDPYIYIKKNPEQHPSKLDQLKNLREGKAVKKGLLLKNNRIQESNITMDKCLKDIPSSIHQLEDYQYVAKDPFTRKVDPERTMSKYDFDAVPNPEILTKSSLYKPLKQNTFEKVK